MFRLVGLLGACVALSGCFHVINREEQAGRDDAYCASIQAPRGSSQYPDCRLRVEQMRQQAASAAVASRPVSCMTYGGITTCN